MAVDRQKGLLNWLSRLRNERQLDRPVGDRLRFQIHEYSYLQCVVWRVESSTGRNSWSARYEQGPKVIKRVSRGRDFIQSAQIELRWYVEPIHRLWRNQRSGGPNVQYRQFSEQSCSCR